jgi:hypothetical protein
MASKLKDRIKLYLMSHPETQDSNTALMGIIWQHEVDRFIINAGGITINPLTLLKNNKLTSWDSATRAKRKLQEEHPELRGKFYNKRKAKSVKVSKDLDNLFGDSQQII